MEIKEMEINKFAEIDRNLPYCVADTRYYRIADENYQNMKYLICSGNVREMFRALNVAHTMSIEFDNVARAMLDGESAYAWNGKDGIIKFSLVK